MSEGAANQPPTQYYATQLATSYLSRVPKGGVALGPSGGHERIVKEAQQGRRRRHRSLGVHGDCLQRQRERSEARPRVICGCSRQTDRQTVSQSVLFCAPGFVESFCLR